MKRNGIFSTRSLSLSSLSTSLSILLSFSSSSSSSSSSSPTSPIRLVSSFSTHPHLGYLSKTTRLPTTSLSLIMNTGTNTDTNTDNGSNSTPYTNNGKIIEVEQKFVVSHHGNENENENEHNSSLKERLIQLGFQPVGKRSKDTNTSSEDDNDIDETVTFMDWYFDILPADQLVLCTQDCWLRYRHMSCDVQQGSWQLKKGSGSGNTSTKSTVYEEIEGDEALLMVKSILNQSLLSNVKDLDLGLNLQKSNNTLKEMDGYKVPTIIWRNVNKEENEDDNGNDLQLLGLLEPYARIETTRSSWTRTIGQEKEGGGDSSSSSSVYDFITVDIDATDFGHMVGEVECVVPDEEDIPNAKTRIQAVIEELMKGSGNGNRNRDPSLTLGKLETYLIQKQPAIYEACMGSGTMKDRT